MQEISWKKLSLRDYWQILMRRRRAILFPLLAVTFIAILGSFFLTPHYQATTTLISEEVERGSVLKGLTSIPIPFSERLDTIKQKVNSRTYLAQVAQITHVKDYLQTQRSKPVLQNDVVDYLRDIVTVRLRGSKIIKVFVTHPVPKLAMDIANAIALVYVDNTLQLRQTEVSASYKFLDEQLQAYREKLDQSEEALRKAKEQGVMESLAKENVTLINELTKIEAELVTNELDVQQARSELNSLRNLDETNKGEINPKVKALETQLAGLQLQLDALSRRYRETWPEVERLKADIASAERKLQQSRSTTEPRYDVKTQIEELENKIKQLSVQKSMVIQRRIEYNRKLEELPQVQLSLSHLIREKETNDEIYKLLLERLHEARLLKASELNKMGTIARVLDPAFEPKNPIKPNKKKIAVMAVALGLMLGFGFGIIFEMFDHSFRNIDQVKRYIEDIPVLATIPRINTYELALKQHRKRQMVAVCAAASVFCLMVFLGDMVNVKFLHHDSYLLGWAVDMVKFVRG